MTAQDGAASTCVLLDSGEGRVEGLCHSGALSCRAEDELSADTHSRPRPRFPSVLTPTGQPGKLHL